VSRDGLIGVGFWQKQRNPRESSGSFAEDFLQLMLTMLEQRLPDPVDLVDLSWDPRERELVAQYLDRGKTFESYAGYSQCRMCSKWNNGSKDLTDGVYIWPEGFSHYLREHGVRPPATFEHHVLERLRRRSRGRTQ